MQFTAAIQYGDTLIDFDAMGTALQIDKIGFGGVLNPFFDDRLTIDAFLFVSGRGNSNVNIAANLNSSQEALLLAGAIAAEG